MHIKLGKKYYIVSIKEALALTLIPIIVCILALILINRNPSYKIDIKIYPSVSPLEEIQRGALKGLDSSVKRIIRLQNRQKNNDRAMQINTKLALLKSWPLMEGFILEYNLKQKLFSNRWNDIDKQWIQPKAGFLVRVIQIFQDESVDSSKNTIREPQTWQAVRMLTNAINIAPNKETSFITVSLNWKDPEEGADLLNNFIDYANIFISRFDQNEISTQIIKIESLLAKEKLSVMQKALLDELGSLKQSSFMISPNFNSAFKVLAPAKSPIEPYFKAPKLLLILLFIISAISTFIGVAVNRTRHTKTKLNA